MSRRKYLLAVIRLFLAQPSAPARASRDDWAVAQALYARGVDFDHFTHAVRLASLRRLYRDGPPLPPVRRLAYYRQVLDQLSPDELEAGYVDYVAFRYQALTNTDARLHRQNRALPDRR
ncbi:MAG: hypothetical protein AAB131_05315 [Actinomycetota bacterium]